MQTKRFFFFFFFFALLKLILNFFSAVCLPLLFFCTIKTIVGLSHFALGKKTPCNGKSFVLNSSFDFQGITYLLSLFF